MVGRPNHALRCARDVPPPAAALTVAIPGGAAAVDQALLAFLAADPGPDDVAALVQAARDAVCLAVAAGHRSRP